MSDRRRGGRRKSNEATQKLSKEEDAIARFVRFNCPTKTTMFEGNEVHYFAGSKAVDILYESKKYGHNAKEVKFATRGAAVTFMRTLLEKGLFFRARKLVAKRKEDKKDGKEKDKGDVGKSPKKKSKKEDQLEKETEEERKGKKKEKAKDSDENDEEEEKEKKGRDKEDEEKKKRKVKLELHQDQSFNDSNDVYVWIFDPTPLFKKVIGALMVLGTIAGCLFPLWPMWLRQGVYYLSLVGLGCFGLLIGVAIARTILFAIIWATTMGRHRLWLLPNLTEDCGFFESFQPWYTYEYCPNGVSATGKKRKKPEDKKKSEEDSDKKTENEEDRKEEKEQRSEAESSSDKTKSRRRKEERGDESAESEEGSASEADEDEEESSQLQVSGISEEGSGEGGGDKKESEHATKVRQRRRARRTNDDFVLVDKQ
uniref:Translocation protein SEC62 n=1 Tax=Ascaris suum TaxID=6253 RepID=F1KW64_ASCSU